MVLKLILYPVDIQFFLYRHPIAPPQLLWWQKIVTSNLETNMEWAYPFPSCVPAQCPQNGIHYRAPHSMGEIVFIAFVVSLCAFVVKAKQPLVLISPHPKSASQP